MTHLQKPAMLWRRSHVSQATVSPDYLISHAISQDTSTTCSASATHTCNKHVMHMQLPFTVKVCSVHLYSIHVQGLHLQYEDHDSLRLVGYSEVGLYLFGVCGYDAGSCHIVYANGHTVHS